MGWLIIEMNENAFIIRGAGNEFYLNKDKVTDNSIKSYLEMQMQYVSYTGGAAAGRMMLGSLGAMNGTLSGQGGVCPFVH